MEQFYLALIAGIFILPFFLFSATAGQIADKFEKSRIIRWIKFFEIVFMIIAVFGFYYQNIWLLMSTLFFLGCHSTFFGPIKYSILPEHLQKSELIAGNGLIEAGTFTAILLGQVLGGGLFGSPNGLFYIAIALITVAVVGFASSLFIPKTKIGQPELQISLNIVKETRKIISIIAQKKIIFVAVIGISWFWFVGATFLTQFPTFTKNTLAGNAQVFTLFLTVFSIGIGVGSLLCNVLLRGKISSFYVPLAILGMSIFILDIYLATRHLTLASIALLNIQDFLKNSINIRILVDVFLITVCGGLYVVPLYAIMQENSDETVRSRVIAGNNIVNAFFMVVSAIYIMVVTALHFSLPQLFLILAVSNLVIVSYMTLMLPNNIFEPLKRLLQR
jgi:acyl-[acyl-carrier-protein]-phospholipid O-acyltransferase/long-chain-fatty-acid--[acyl-carrier-protein] ligase